MTISDERLDAFINAWHRAHGERLTRAEALDAAVRVLAFVRLLSKEPVQEHPTDEPAIEDR